VGDLGGLCEREPRPALHDECGSWLLSARDVPERFAPVYEVLHAPVLAFFYRRTASVELSADLAAETFAVALARLQRFRPDLGTGRAWVFGIAANLYRQWLRRNRVADRARVIGIATPPLADDDLSAIDTYVDLQAQLGDLQDALATLPQLSRDAVICRIAHGLSYAEIARLEGCTEVAARVRVKRGLDGLNASLAKRLPTVRDD